MTDKCENTEAFRSFEQVVILMLLLVAINVARFQEAMSRALCYKETNRYFYRKTM